jgi:hypothetical protein
MPARCPVLRWAMAASASRRAPRAMLTSQSATQLRRWSAA